MPDDDWSRTAVNVSERGGALVTAFDLDAAEKVDPTRLPSGERRGVRTEPTAAADLWANFEFFLREIVPAAEGAGVALALHPDDPPLSSFRGQDRIIIDYDACERALALRASHAHGLCFCQGTFASAGEDVVAGIRRFAPYTHFAHFRDVVGRVPYFRESFHDTGDTDMAAAMRAWVEADFRGPMRPDHVPTLDGEDNTTPGYHMLGRLWALGYMKGLLDAI
jgi:mannonate dehydratase